MAEAPYDAFLWETPPITKATAKRGFEFVLVDSPDLAWERYFPSQGIEAVRQKRFVSMLAVTTSGYAVDVRLGTTDQEVTYVVDVDVSLLTSSARVVVQFLKEEQLERFLRSL